MLLLMRTPCRSGRQEKRVRYIGITHYTSSAYGAVERELKANPWDFLQINYSLGERDSENEFFRWRKNAKWR